MNLESLILKGKFFVSLAFATASVGVAFYEIIEGKDRVDYSILGLSALSAIALGYCSNKLRKRIYLCDEMYKMSRRLDGARKNKV